MKTQTAVLSWMRSLRAFLPFENHIRQHRRQVYGESSRRIRRPQAQPKLHGRMQRKASVGRVKSRAMATPYVVDGWLGLRGLRAASYAAEKQR